MSLDHKDGGLPNEIRISFYSNAWEERRFDRAATVPLHRRENLGRIGNGDEIRQCSRARRPQKSFLELITASVDRRRADVPRRPAPFFPHKITAGLANTGRVGWKIPALTFPAAPDVEANRGRVPA